MESLVTLTIQKIESQDQPNRISRKIFNFRGGISVVTENGRETQSHLVIRNARPSDEGNYTCKPSIFKTASVRLYVLDGKFQGYNRNLKFILTI